jgi:hypothetical protein
MKTFRILTGVAVCLVAAGQTAPPQTLDRIVDAARIKPIAPRPSPPDWMSWERVHAGLVFYQEHHKQIDPVLGTSSLVSTYAAVDIAPVLMRTGRLARDYQQRIRETGQWIGTMLDPQPAAAQFLAHNYRRAVALGKLHQGIAASMTPKELGWDPARRVPVNQQAYAFVLYSFAWQPIETMLAAHELDAKRDAEGLDNWCYLWTVLGYAMGVEEPLLPRSYARAAQVEPLLRAQQYASSPNAIPHGVPVLLRGELRMLMSGTDTPEAKQRAAQSLALAISLSPGLRQALGLGDRPAAHLLKLLDSPR